MFEIGGISLPRLPFSIDEFVGVLLFHEYPVTAVYSTNNGMPIIKEWIDCNDNTDRYFYYRASPLNLKKFIEGKLSQGDFIRNATDELIFVADERKEEIININLISTSQIPEEYLLSEDIYFDAKNGVQTKKIIDYFDLSNIKILPLNIDEQLRKIAKQKASEIFNLHLKEGKSVRYGRADTDVLGSALLTFDNLYKEVALDYFFGTNRGQKKITKEDKKEKLQLSTTEVFMSKAASLIIYLKPKHKSQIDLFESKSSSELISQKLFNLFTISKDAKALEENYLNYSDFVFKSYREFLKSIMEYDIKLDIDWTDHDGHSLISEDFTLFKAHKIVSYIDTIHSEETDQFEVTGKFQAINIKTGSFTFVSLSDELYNGYFDKLVKDGIQFLNFTQLYLVSVERKKIKETGSSEAKIKDKIVAHYLIEE